MVFLGLFWTEPSSDEIGHFSDCSPIRQLACTFLTLFCDVDTQSENVQLEQSQAVWLLAAGSFVGRRGGLFLRTSHAVLTPQRVGQTPMGEKRQGDIEDDGDDAKRLKPDDEVNGDGSEEDEDGDDETGSDEDEDEDEDDEEGDTDVDSEEEEELDLVMREDGRVHAPAVDYLELDTFRTFPDLVQGLDQDAKLHARILADCRRVFTARSVKKNAGGGAKQQYSSGETFWIAAQDEPRCALEHLAQQIFHLHVTDAARRWEDECEGDPDAPPPFDPARSGAEWWTQVIDPTHDAIGLHWDKDYALEHNDLNVHPHVGTVTYFANEGAPTLFVRATTPVYYGQPVTGPFGPRCGVSPDDMADPPGGTGVYLSWPRRGKHASFDGKWLHGAPGELAECRDEEDCEDGEEKGGEENGDKGNTGNKGKAVGAGNGEGKGPRVTFLVNVWLNHVPSTAAPCPEDVVKDLSTEPYLPEIENPDDVDEDPPAMFSVMGNYDTVFKEMSWEFEHDGRTHALRVYDIPKRWVSREAGGGGCALGDGISVAIVGGSGEVTEKQTTT